MDATTDRCYLLLLSGRRRKRGIDAGNAEEAGLVSVSEGRVHEARRVERRRGCCCITALRAWSS